ASRVGTLRSIRLFFSPEYWADEKQRCRTHVLTVEEKGLLRYSNPAFSNESKRFRLDGHIMP
ncbi:MAG TPA: hypothetical protein VJ873_07120, partial [bacterium]|nr:hypothetical protein [bacterium]